MNRSIRNPFRSWMVIYISLIAVIVLQGRPVDAPEQNALLPVPAIVGSAPIFRKDI